MFHLPGPRELALNALFIIPMMLSLTVHEWAHAFSAYRLGDDTASREGRLTLNPMAHIDPIGTILLPLLGVPFGWAKPVPVNPTRFNRSVTMSTGMAITAAAGPLSNLVLAFICAVTMGVMWRVAPTMVHREGVFGLLQYGLTLNVGLAIFNLLPLPPLDGSRIVERWVPYKYRDTWETFRSIAPMLLLVVIASGGLFLSHRRGQPGVLRAGATNRPGLTRYSASSPISSAVCSVKVLVRSSKVSSS
jgi:Zn-dependent protease